MSVLGRVGVRRCVAAVVAVCAGATAYAANAVQQVQYRAGDDAFVVLTTVEGYTPEDHKAIVDLYQQRQDLVFIPVDFAVRMFEQNQRLPGDLQGAGWMPYKRTQEGKLVACETAAPISSTELSSSIRTRGGQLFVTGDLLSYYQQTIVPGAVVDEILKSYRGPLMDKAAIDKEIARRDAGESMKIWTDYRGLGYDNALEFMSAESLKMLSAAADADGAQWSRKGDLAECVVPMTDDDARGMKRSTEWWLAYSRRTQQAGQSHLHAAGYQHQLERQFAAAFQVSCHLSPINGQGLKLTVNMPESMEVFSSQTRLQSDTRDGKVMSKQQDYILFQNYDSMRELLAANPAAEVNWAIRDRKALASKHSAGELRFSSAPAK